VEDFISWMCPDCKGAGIVKICQDIAKYKVARFFGTHCQVLTLFLFIRLGAEDRREIPLVQLYKRVAYRTSMIFGQRSGTSMGNVYRPRVWSCRVGSGRVNIRVPATDTLQLHWDAHCAALDVSSALGSS